MTSDQTQQYHHLLLHQHFSVLSSKRQYYHEMSASPY